MMDFIESVQFICMVLYLALGWRGLLVLALVALGAGTLAFRIAYRLGQRSVAGISSKQYARLRKVREKLEERA